MITVISGTNRHQSKTKLIAAHCYDLLMMRGLDVRWVDLSEIKGDILSPTSYNEQNQHPEITRIQNEAIIPADAFLIISPEYNGSYPGVLKTFIDAVSVRKYRHSFTGKKAALIGVASGRAGNLRGMDHLTGVLNYLNVTVMPNKLPVSSVGNFTDDKNIHATLGTVLEEFVAEVVAFTQIGEVEYNKD